MNCWRTATNQFAIAKHPGHAHCALGRESGERRSEAGGHARIHAASDGQAGGSGTREALEDYSRGRRVLGGAAAGGRREIAGHRTGQRAVALSANFDGDRCGKEHDGSVSGSGGLFLWNAEDVWTAGRKRLTGCEQGLRAFVATTRLGYGELRRYRNHTGHGKNAGYIFRPGGAVRCFFRHGIFAGSDLSRAKRRGSYFVKLERTSLPADHDEAYW